VTSTTYNTIKNSQSIRLSIEKCRFWAFISPVSGEEEAKSMRDNLRGQYPEATHHIFAYRLLLGGQLRERSNDDGEPTGTAGLPVLEALRKKQLVNLQLVVIRYFGGIKLGTGGLKRAYSRTALKAIEEAGIINMKLHQWIHLKIDYSHWGKIEHYLTQHHIPTDKLVFTDMVSFNIPLLPCDEQTVLAKVAEIVGGVPIMEKLEREYLASLNTD